MAGTNLTPIKIPGKNRRDQCRSTVAANRNKRCRPPGRPPKILDSDLSRDLIPVYVKSDRSAKHRSLKNLKPTREMANLERLPTEILTPVFLFSMNLDLPRASPIIARKLSSRLTVLEAITNAFSPTWEYYYEFVKGYCQIKSPVPGDPVIQSAMLRCKCVTFSVLKHAEATWLQRASLDKGSKPIPDQICSKCCIYRTLGPHEMDKLCRHELRYRRGRDDPIDHCISRYRSRWRHKIIDDCFVEDYAEFRQLSSERIFQDMPGDFNSRWAWTSFLHMHPQLDIPESLLQGPWTADMVECLFWLIRADAKVGWTNSTNGEVALLGLKNAISTGNLQILYIFRYLGLAHNVTLKMVEWAIDHAGGDKIEVIARLMRMFLCLENSGCGYPSLVRLELAGTLSRMRVLAELESERDQDKGEAVALVKALESYWDFLSRTNDTIMGKGWSTPSDRVLQ